MTGAGKGSWKSTKPPALEDECIEWHGRQHTGGYGVLSVRSREVFAHRLIWEEAFGPIPEGMTVDHLCGVRLCINPNHLELVSRGENARRGGLVLFCKHGHPMWGENVYYTPAGRRHGCRACRSLDAARSRAKRDAGLFHSEAK